MILLFFYSRLSVQSENGRLFLGQCYIRDHGGIVRPVGITEKDRHMIALNNVPDQTRHRFGENRCKE